MNISGVLVHTTPGLSETVRQQLNSLDGVEVHASENNRLVVTVETRHTGEMADRVSSFHNMKGIVSAAVIYHHDEDIESELNTQESATEISGAGETLQ